MNRGSGNQPTNGNDETLKRLVRSASELVRKLDAVFVKIKTCQDLFSPELIELRQQLSYLCSKSLLTDPLQCRRKAEELLWRKCYYNVVSAAKTHSKKSPLKPQEAFYLESHIDCGISKLTEHLLDACLRLNQSQPLVPVLSGLAVHFLPLQNCVLTGRTESNESRDDLLDSVQRILVWLGDLCRYKIDLGLDTNYVLALRYYQQAAIVNPSNGLPFNQLGTLLSNPFCSQQELESIAQYLRSMSALKSFPGAGPNLRQLLDRISTRGNDLTSNLALLIIRSILEPRGEDSEMERLCQLILSSLQKRLQHSELDSKNQVFLELVDTAIVLALMSEGKFASGTEDAASLGCSLLSLVLTKCCQVLKLESDESNHSSIPEVIVDNENEAAHGELEEEDELKRARIRRRKKLSDSETDSDTDDVSDEEFFLDQDDSTSTSTESEDDEKEPATVQSVQLLDIPPEIHCYLPVLLILSDWLRSDKPILTASAQSACQLWSQMTTTLNGLLRIKMPSNLELFSQHALPEDWRFYGYPSRIFNNVDFSATQSPDEETLAALRIQRVIQFGHWLASEAAETGLKYVDGSFVCNLVVNSATVGNEDSKKDLMMRNMATLWLKSEVQDLEDKLQSGSSRKSSKKSQQRHKNGGKMNKNRNPKMNPPDFVGLTYVYIVVDASALTEYQSVIKRLVKGQKWIIVVPDVVVSELDQLKKESSSVRDCIRWLETCFRTGNRFLRAQRQNEHKPIPLMTYPKRKDKTNWTFFQIMECCHYLDSQQRDIYRNGQDSPIVLLLSGQFREGQDQQMLGVCQTIGVDIKNPDSISDKRQNHSTGFVK